LLRRENEAEMMFRARDICRALQRYQRDRGTLPTKFEQLIEPGSKGQYFIRQLYKDPLVKDGKWGFLFLAPGGGIYDPHGEAGAGGVDASGNPIVTPGASPFGGAQQGAGGGLSRMGQANSNPGQPGAGGSSTARPGGAFGRTVGGAGGEGGEAGLPIAGVKSLSTDKPFRVFRDQENYAKWLFAFNDQDLQPPPVPGSGPATPPRFPGQTPGQFPGQLTPGKQGLQTPTNPSAPPK